MVASTWDHDQTVLDSMYLVIIMYVRVCFLLWRFFLFAVRDAGAGSEGRDKWARRARRSEVVAARRFVECWRIQDTQSYTDGVEESMLD